MVKLPSAMPMIFAGLHIAVIFSILGAIVGEFVGSKKGLGNLILQMNFNLDTRACSPRSSASRAWASRCT
jgi:NitT/TauT family transport system permease protein